MEMKQQLEAIESLLPILHNATATGKLIIHPDEKQILIRVYQHIYHVLPNVNCGTCVLHYLNMLSAYYERENHLYQLANPPAPAPVVEEPKKPKKKNVKD